MIEFSANLEFLIKVIYNTFPKEVIIHHFSISDTLMGLLLITEKLVTIFNKTSLHFTSSPRG